MQCTHKHRIRFENTEGPSLTQCAGCEVYVNDTGAVVDVTVKKKAAKKKEKWVKPNSQDDD